MVLLGFGSRNWKDLNKIRETLKEYGKDVILVEGGALGADRGCRIVAKELGWDIITVNADWAIHGKAAGSIRNQKMLDDYRIDKAVGFWDGQSRGSKDMIDRLDKAKIDTLVVRQ